MKLKYFKKKAESFYYEAGGCDSKFERYWTWINGCSPLMLTCSTTLHKKMYCKLMALLAGNDGNDWQHMMESLT